MGTDIIIRDISEGQEQTLSGSAGLVVAKADMIVVTDTTSYGNAADFLKEIKAGISTVKNTFADMKSAANAAHKAICDKENFFLKPLNAADGLVRNKMRIYNDEIERKRREDEARLREEQRRIAEEQMQRALELEQAGKQEQAKAALETVTALENLKPVVQYDKPKADGISTQVAYEIEITDPKAVPAYFNGVELRSINESAIRALAKATKGEIQIPGVTIIKTNSIKVR